MPPLAADEPELLDPLELRVTNGIAFTRGMDTLYHSRWSPPAEPGGSLQLRLFQSRRVNGRWTAWNWKRRRARLAREAG